MSDHFADATGYERATGRFSRQVAREFVPWLGVRRDARWLDCGCGTGALTSAIIDLAWAGEVTGLDSSQAFLEHARRSVPGARFEAGSVVEMPFADAQFDAAVAGCVLHHLASPEAGLAEMRRVTAPGGTVATYEWAGGFSLNQIYWQAALATGAAEPGADRTGLQAQEELTELFAAGGLVSVQSQRFDAAVEFAGFDEWWDTVLGRRARVFDHYSSLDKSSQSSVRDRARELVGPGGFRVQAAVWAVKGRR